MVRRILQARQAVGTHFLGAGRKPPRHRLQLRRVPAARSRKGLVGDCTGCAASRSPSVGFGASSALGRHPDCSARCHHKWQVRQGTCDTATRYACQSASNHRVHRGPSIQLSSWCFVCTPDEVDDAARLPFRPKLPCRHQPLVALPRKLRVPQAVQPQRVLPQRLRSEEEPSSEVKEGESQ